MHRRGKVEANHVGNSVHDGADNVRDNKNAIKQSQNSQQQQQQNQQYLPISYVIVGIMMLVGTCIMFVVSIIFFRPPIPSNSLDTKLLIRTGVPLSLSSSSKQTQLQQKQQQQRQQQHQHPKTINENDKPEYHIVFSTGCSIYQDWQSYVFFYQAMEINQPGTITRIVSGCSAMDEDKLRTVFNDQIRPMSNRFQIHFTPDYSTPRLKMPPYVYFNKPFGMKHWLENKLGFPLNPQNEHAIVILLDPDQLILRPFQDNNFSNTIWHRIGRNTIPRIHVEHGKPMGQLYGFDLQFLKHVNMSFLLAPNETSHITGLDREVARAGYVVGPPYVATARDMYNIVVKWCDFALPVHDQYPHLLAEMFAYCLAAAHLGLAHQTAVSFMVSSVGIGGAEGWAYVDAIHSDELCLPTSPEQLPNVLHYCQVYGLGKYYFGKRRFPKDFLSCESPLLAEIPNDFMADYAALPPGRLENLKPIHAKRNKFMLCYLLGSLNRAAIYYKQQHCLNSSMTTSLAKTLKLLT